MWVLVLSLVLLGWSARVQAAPIVTITPATDLQASITANEAGTTFRLTAGTHRRGSLVAKNGNTFLGDAGAILSGGEVLATWTASGSDWYATGQTQAGEVLNAGSCLSGFAQCANPEDVFYDGVPLQAVANQAALGTGKFFFDYAADRIYIRDNPAGHTVETSVRPSAFSGTAQNVTLKNLQIEKFAAPTQKGAIEVSATSHGWLIEQCVFRHNHGYGIHVTGSGWTLRGNTISVNGHMGVGGGGVKNLLVEGNTINDNNYARINPGFESGGVKMAASRAVRYLRNQVANNYGTGLWCDIDCVDVLYAGNTVSGNSGVGIFHEISYHAVVRHNTSLDNGTVQNGWLFGSQIGLANSERSEVYGNVVHIAAAGGAGIALSQQNRGAGLWGTYRVRLTSVHHNTLRYATGTTFNSGISGAADDFYNDIEEQGNVWDFNVVFVDPNALVWAWPVCPHDAWAYATFQGCGRDEHGKQYAP